MGVWRQAKSVKNRKAFRRVFTNVKTGIREQGTGNKGTREQGTWNLGDGA
jgi:hypothetical protein